MGVRDDIRDGANEESILFRLRAGVDNRREFDWPGKPGVKVGLRLLSAKENTGSKFANQREFKTSDIDIAIHNLPDYKEQEADHILWKALYDPATGKAIFSSVDAFRGFCTREEVSALAFEYNALSEECDPKLDDLDDAGIKELVEFVKKKPDLIHSRVSNLPVAWKLLRILADQQQT